MNLASLPYFRARAMYYYWVESVLKISFVKPQLLLTVLAGLRWMHVRGNTFSLVCRHLANPSPRKINLSSQHLNTINPNPPSSPPVRPYRPGLTTYPRPHHFSPLISCSPSSPSPPAHTHHTAQHELGEVDIKPQDSNWLPSQQT